MVVEEYPRFELTFAKGGGIIPVVSLPKNYKELVLGFYDSAGKERVLSFVKGLEELTSKEILLDWDSVDGLTSISLSNCGLDLNERGEFQEHNLNYNWQNCFVCGSVAQKYVYELLKTK